LPRWMWQTTSRSDGTRPEFRIPGVG
jgi:hypothetical protein